MGAKIELSAQFLEQLERLSLVCRRPVRGWAAGDRTSRQPGRSVEFCDYRHYGTGDDLRYVDWNVFARTDRLYLKLFADDEDLCLHLLVDASGSMDWGTPSKLRWAARLAAALGFVALARLERVAVSVLRDALAESSGLLRGRGAVGLLFELLGGLDGVGSTNLNAALASHAARAQGAGLAVVVSDLLDPGGYEQGLKSLLERRFEVHLIHVLSPEELEPALVGDLRLVDHETGESRPLSIDAAALRVYRERLQSFLDGAEAFCRKHAIQYQRAASDVPVETFALAALRGRLLA